VVRSTERKLLGLFFGVVVVQALLQRVSHSSVAIDGTVVGSIERGLLVLLCAERGDNEDVARRLVEKIAKLRVFEDAAGKMNLSVQDISGALLIVSQFTLAADTSKGNRPSFIGAALPEDGRRLYDVFVGLARQTGLTVQTGVFAANMQVSLVNDGPVTIGLAIRTPS
jgi:D-tyrosyl-tRNA(Tyr) deacylase